MSSIRILNATILYPNIFTPVKSNFTNNETEKYKCTLLIDKTDEKMIRTINLAIKEAAEEATQTIWKGIRPKERYSPLQDGDGTMKNGNEWGPECQNKWVIRASSTRKPGVLDGLNGKERMTDPKKLYSGCRVHVTVDFFGYNVSGNKGIACGIKNIMKIAEGERLDGTRTAEEDFSDIPPIAAKQDNVTHENFINDDEFPF